MPDTYWSVTTPAGDFDLVAAATIADDEVRSRDVMQHMHQMIDVLADRAGIARAAAQALAELNAEETSEETASEEETVPEDPSGVVPEEDDGSAVAEEWAPPGMRWLEGVLVPLEADDDALRAVIHEEGWKTEGRVEREEQQQGASLSRIADALEASAAIAVLALDMPEDVKERADAIMTRWLGQAQPR